MLRVAFAGTFAARLEERVRAQLGMPCDVIVDGESGIVSKLSEVDVLVTLAFTRGPEALDEVLRRADYLVITLSLTEATQGLLGERGPRMMKPSAILINVARAEIVEEAALYRALAERTIAGAALDVWYRYPTSAGATLPSRYAFHELPNLLMTPHVSGWTEGMLEARAKLIAENIHRAVRDEPPLNLIR